MLHQGSTGCLLGDRRYWWRFTLKLPNTSHRVLLSYLLGGKSDVDEHNPAPFWFFFLLLSFPVFPPSNFVYLLYSSCSHHSEGLPWRRWTSRGGGGTWPTPSDVSGTNIEPKMPLGRYPPRTSLVPTNRVQVLVRLKHRVIRKIVE